MEAAQAHLSLHLSKCHIVGNHMSRLKVILTCATLFGVVPAVTSVPELDVD